MKTPKPIEGIPHNRLSLASLRATITPGITGSPLSDATEPKWVNWHNPALSSVSYDCTRDQVSLRALMSLDPACPDLLQFPQPNSADMATAVPVDIGILTGCKATCGAQIDWAQRNNNAIDISEDSLLLRYLWNGVAGLDGPVATPTPHVVAGQTTIVGSAGASIGSFATIEDALVATLKNLSAQGAYGQRILYVPHDMLGTRTNSPAWQQQGDALYFNGHKVLGIQGPALGGPGGAAGWWVAASGPIQWEIIPGTTLDLELQPELCRFESGLKTTKVGMIRMACWPKPAIAEVK
jgi:hypothetical protein